MTLSELTSADAVRQAAAEVHRLGQRVFLDRYGYTESAKYVAVVDGVTYDSKPLLSFAYGIQFPRRGPLSTSTFNGGAQSRLALKRLGFDLIPKNDQHGDPTPSTDVSRARQIPLEISLISEFRRVAVDALVATKVEQSLIDEFTELQRAKGRTFTRWEIFPRGSSERLLTDLYDEETLTLYEAKASSTRPDVRLGLGQILDYSRFIDECEALALLLPSRPSDDLVDLLHSFQVRAVWRKRPGIFESSHESIYLD
ncbi:hypothetical protein QFZ65_003290 [Arthrobacter sp. B3I9]|uniref:hypothetical protein n=1 Tax=Arthrobacter sp. B3I9 TaxID=3042270 RepID=UPI00278D0AC2|nr:hypothetical protein [Arthrobacter sp. B3I9]MDQ0851352.1 hypothetical protein [Arthrobacter sp. B3I9]